MLKIENLSWTTEDGTEVLRDVSLEIPDGKVVVITGPNGSGKTSLAKLIAGIYKPTSGKIILNGEDINPAQRLIAVRVAIMEQNCSATSTAARVPILFAPVK